MGGMGRGSQLRSQGVSCGAREVRSPCVKLNIQKMKIMACGPITSWEIDGETVETVSDFIFLGSKITADAGAGKGLILR